MHIEDMSKEEFKHRLEEEKEDIEELALGYDITFRVGKASTSTKDKFFIGADVDKVVKAYGKDFPYDLPTRFVGYRRSEDIEWTFTMLDMYITSIGTFINEHKKLPPYALGKNGEFALMYIQSEFHNIPNKDLNSFFMATKQFGDKLYACGMFNSLYSNDFKRGWQKLLPNENNMLTPEKIIEITNEAGDDLEKAIRLSQSYIAPTHIYKCLDGWDEEHIYLAGHSMEFKGIVSHWNGKIENILQTDYNLMFEYILVESEDKIWLAGNEDNYRPEGKVVVGNFKDGFHKVYEPPRSKLGEIVNIIKYESKIYIGYQYGIGYIDESSDNITMINFDISFDEIVTIDSFENVLWVMEKKKLHRFENRKWETSTYKWSKRAEQFLTK